MRTTPSFLAAMAPPYRPPTLTLRSIGMRRSWLWLDRHCFIPMYRPPEGEGNAAARPAPRLIDPPPLSRPRDGYYRPAVQKTAPHERGLDAPTVPLPRLPPGGPFAGRRRRAAARRPGANRGRPRPGHARPRRLDVQARRARRLPHHGQPRRPPGAPRERVLRARSPDAAAEGREDRPRAEGGPGRQRGDHERARLPAPRGHRRGGGQEVPRSRHRRLCARGDPTFNLDD